MSQEKNGLFYGGKKKASMSSFVQAQFFCAYKFSVLKLLLRARFCTKLLL